MSDDIHEEAGLSILKQKCFKEGTELRGAQLSAGIGSYAQQQTVVARDRKIP